MIHLHSPLTTALQIRNPNQIYGCPALKHDFERGSGEHREAEGPDARGNNIHRATTVTGIAESPWQQSSAYAGDGRTVACLGAVVWLVRALTGHLTLPLPSKNWFSSAKLAEAGEGIG